MCGIAGLVGRSDERVESAQVRQMCDTIVHRGPDDDGIYARGPVGLGMRRLSIIDLSGGRQPIHNEDQTVWVVFNGEIYNFPELRAELEQKGHQFYTHSDTEVIVHLYEDLGADCVKKLRGMFAIALYDERKQYLLLARDRLGKKPLHYALDNGRLYFGSEIKTILAVAPQLADVDTEGILQFFYFDYIPDPYTAFKKIRKLPPGNLLEYEKGQLRIRQYWDVPEYGTYSPATEEQCLSELEQKLAEAVRIRLISDVPLGALLSGGVDSSIVVALMARASSRPVKTFSIGFENEDFNELQYARMVAQRFGTDHHEMVVRPNVAETLEKLSRMMEEPFGDSSMIPTYHVSAMARKHVTVALAGDGGDELFAGYDRYMVNLQRQHYDRIPQWLGRAYRNYAYPLLPASLKGRKLSWNVSLPTRERYLDGLSFLPACHRERALFCEAFLESVSQVPDPFEQFRAYYDSALAPDPLSRLLYLDTKTYMTADVLAKVDRMSMAASLEVRAPILDHKFVEYAASLKPEWKFRNGTRKYILKKLAERVGVPSELLHRRKQGFALPLVHWMRGDLAGLLAILQEPRTLQRGFFKPNTIRSLVDEHITGRRDRSGILWQLLVFELWFRNFLERQFGCEAAGSCHANTSDPAPSHIAPNREQAHLRSAIDESPVQEKKLRVAIVAPSLRKVGGQAVQASLLVSHWQDDREVRPEFVPIDPQFPRFLAWAEHIPFVRTIVRMPLYWGSLWKSIGRCDVAHIFSASYSSFLLAPTPAWLIAGLRGKRTVVNYRSGEAQDHLENSAIARAILRRMDTRVVPSAYLHRVFSGFGLQTEVVPNMVDLSQIRYRERDPLRPILMCNRGCEPYYAIDDVVRAFAHAQALFPEAKLLLVGGGTLEPQIRELVDRLRVKNVEFVGKVQRAEIGKYYDDADIFVNASWLDNMPVSVLEAFAAGTPVVSTAPEGIRYIVEHGRTGLLSEPRNWRALGENIVTVLKNPALARSLARSAYEQSRQYRWEHVRPQWLRLYQSALAGERNQVVKAAGVDGVNTESITAEVK